MYAVFLRTRLIFSRRSPLRVGANRYVRYDKSFRNSDFVRRNSHNPRTFGPGRRTNIPPREGLLRRRRRLELPLEPLQAESSLPESVESEDLGDSELCVSWRYRFSISPRLTSTPLTAPVVAGR